MALQKSFESLCVQLRELQEGLEALNTTVEEDKPRRKDVVVASTLSDAVLAVRGTLEESRTAADEACEAAAHPLDVDRARRALTACQERFHCFASEFAHDLVSHERMADLASVGRERGRDWANWVKVVRQGLEQCQALVEEGRDALFLCWQELTERLATPAVPVRAIGIGQAFPFRKSIEEPAEFK